MLNVVLDCCLSDAAMKHMHETEYNKILSFFFHCKIFKLPLLEVLICPYLCQELYVFGVEYLFLTHDFNR